MKLYSLIGCVLLIFGCLLFQEGCAPFKSTRVAAVAFTMQDVAQAAAKQSDLTIIREGTPAYLMLVDGLIEAYPENQELLVAACRAYSSYASSFISEEQRGETAALYQKAKLYGFRALSERHEFGQAAAGSPDEFQGVLQDYHKGDIPALFCTASAWASWISNNLDSVEAVADLPMLEATMKRILELDDTYYYGGPHLLMAVYLAAKPEVLGGNPAEAKRHFDQVFALGGDKLLMARVLYAKYYARAIKDRDLFVRTLEAVVAAPADQPPELTLANTIAKKEAEDLLNKTEEYFAQQP